jgi:hypothetical protein
LFEMIDNDIFTYPIYSKDRISVIVGDDGSKFVSRRIFARRNDLTSYRFVNSLDRREKLFYLIDDRDSCL